MNDPFSYLSDIVSKHFHSVSVIPRQKQEAQLSLTIDAFTNVALFLWVWWNACLKTGTHYQ